MQNETFKISGMSCDHCIHAVTKEIKKLSVEKMDVTIGSARVEYDEKKVSHDNIIAAIREAGYEVVQ
ncbi:MAG TPA: cation transporter [Candidatus Kapabacteria bacterium]|nr:cation transporter [Candidatus Kapabacteria bacterium]